MAFVKSKDVACGLLNDVKEETFVESVDSLRDVNLNYPEATKPYFGVATIDRIVDIFDRHAKGMTLPPVLEITSVAPASGKTHLLYLLATMALLPDSRCAPIRSYAREPPIVVVFDTDGRFDVERLETIMRKRLHQALPESDQLSESATMIVQNTLRHLHIFQPQSLGGLVASVQSLPDYLFAFHSHFSHNRSLDLLLIDSLSAFFWQRHWAEEIAGLDADHETSSLDESSNYRSLVHGLQKLQKTFRTSIVATQWGVSPLNRKPSNQVPAFRSLLPAQWQSFCTLRLVVQRDPVKRFPPRISVEQAMDEANDRQKIVELNRFSGIVNRSDNESWDDDLRELLKRDARNSQFAFSILADDVIVHA